MIQRVTPPPGEHVDRPQGARKTLRVVKPVPQKDRVQLAAALVALKEEHEESKAIERRMCLTVAVARRNGASWQQIAEAYGAKSRQAAWERFADKIEGLAEQ